MADYDGEWPNAMPAVISFCGRPLSPEEIKLVRDLVQGDKAPRTGRAFDFKIAPVVVVEFLQRFDYEEIYREQYRPAPVRVSAEEAGIGFAGLV